RYSVVMNSTASTVRTVSAANVPTRRFSTAAPTSSPAAGARSPDPLTVTEVPDSWTPAASLAFGRPGSAPMTWGCQGPAAQPPARSTRSKVADATSALPAVEVPPPKCCWLWSIPGDVANSPAGTAPGRPRSRAVPTVVQVLPSVDEYPVTVSPVRDR